MIEGVGAVLTALTALVVAFGGVLQQRANRRIAHAEETERDLERQNRRVRVALAHIAMLEEQMAARGLEVPQRRRELSPAWAPGDEDDKPQAVSK